ncbi:protein JASON isoform X1 [Helianthus annuus]|nr:protein JASON isoform X1 [Helianthus annuus]
MTQIGRSLVLEFIHRSMRCFSCCFRIRDDHRYRINSDSHPITAIAKEPVDPLASGCVWSVVASAEEDRDISQHEDGRYCVAGSPVLDDELRAEMDFKSTLQDQNNLIIPLQAKFLKASGTLPQTPVDIRKTEKLKDSQPHNEDPEPTFHSTHSSTSLKNTGGISSSSSEVCGIEPDSCSFSSKSSSHKITNVPLNPSESLFNHIISKPSPNTTPFKLTDDMQTLGTVFPPYGNNPRVKFQYVYSPMNTKKFSQLDEPVQESPQSQVKLQASTKSNYEGCVDQSLVPASYGQTPGDRPILGVVTAYWNADETPFTPKWGDGNGIPNTTNKYREDQKVSWHATPFEERLEKALMEDKFIHKRKRRGEIPVTEF